MCAMTGDLLSGLVGREKKGILIYIVCALTGDLLSGLVYRQRYIGCVCFCTLVDDLFGDKYCIEFFLEVNFTTFASTPMW